MPHDSLAAYAAVFATLYAAHQVGDHWLQTNHQAVAKGLAGRPGRKACAAHVATHTATAAAAIFALQKASGTRLRPGRIIAGLAVSAATHYLADRRKPLQRMARATGRQAFHDLGLPRAGRDDNPTLGTGAYALDQSWHVAWLAVSALIMSKPARRGGFGRHG